MYQSYLGRCHKTHLLNWIRPTESDSRVHTYLGHSVTHTTLKTQGLEVAMTGSRHRCTGGGPAGQKVAPKCGREGRSLQ